jgi:hypothetical protein
MEIDEGVVVPNYVSKTDAEIKELALQLYRGEIFTSMQIPEESMQLLGSIFMPLIFLDAIAQKQLIVNGAFSFYEFISEAGPRSINGFPSFISMRYLNKEDTRRVLDRFFVIEKALNDV